MQKKHSRLQATAAPLVPIVRAWSCVTLASKQTEAGAQLFVVGKAGARAQSTWGQASLVRAVTAANHHGAARLNVSSMLQVKACKRERRSIFSRWTSHMPQHVNRKRLRAARRSTSRLPQHVNRQRVSASVWVRSTIAFMAVLRSPPASGDQA